MPVIQESRPPGLHEGSAAGFQPPGAAGFTDIRIIEENSIPPDQFMRTKTVKRESCSYAPAPSAAMSSNKSVIGSPLDWNSQDFTGIRRAA